MVISHKYRYLFVAVQRTGSTAISAELCELYDGQPILEKHSYYSTFLRQATEDEKSYRVLSGIRNPLDDVVSSYRKFSTLDKTSYKGSRRMLKRHAFVQSRSLTFSEYLHKYYRFPFDHWTSTYHDRFENIIRFEHLQEDFADAVCEFGADLVRPLPQKNRTDREKDFTSYFSHQDIRKAVRIFGPYMSRWGYEFPARWGPQGVPWSSTFAYWLLGGARRFYWNNIRQSEGLLGKGFRKVFIE